MPYAAAKSRWTTYMLDSINSTISVHATLPVSIAESSTLDAPESLLSKVTVVAATR